MPPTLRHLTSIALLALASCISACTISEAEAQSSGVPRAVQRYWEPRQAIVCFHARDMTGRRNEFGCGRPALRLAAEACGMCAYDFSSRATAAERRTHRDACCFQTTGDY